MVGLSLDGATRQQPLSLLLIIMATLLVLSSSTHTNMVMAQEQSSPPSSLSSIAPPIAADAVLNNGNDIGLRTRRLPGSGVRYRLRDIPIVAKPITPADIAAAATVDDETSTDRANADDTIVHTNDDDTDSNSNNNNNEQSLQQSSSSQVGGNTASGLSWRLGIVSGMMLMMGVIRACWAPFKQVLHERSGNYLPLPVHHDAND